MWVWILNDKRGNCWGKKCVPIPTKSWNCVDSQRPTKKDAGNASNVGECAFEHWAIIKAILFI